MEKEDLKNIIISRTDSIGDVVLTLPACGVLKSSFPKCKIHFIGRGYTRPVAVRSTHIDEYIDWDELKAKSPAAQIEIIQKINADAIIHFYPRNEILWLAKKAGIPIRVASGRKFQAITKSNKLIFPHKETVIHEAQRNIRFLKPLGIEKIYSCDELGNFYSYKHTDEGAKKKVNDFLKSLPDAPKRIIFHPLSKGNFPQWALKDYQKLAEELPLDEFQILVSGAEEEGQEIRKQLSFENKNMYDVCGQFSLSEMVELIDACDMLVSGNTGILHIAAALGKRAIGLYSPKHAVFASRWAPLGVDVRTLTASTHPAKGGALVISSQQVAAQIFS